jgi:two-component sensor histidine kinase
LNVPENALYQEAIEIETRISGPDHRAVKYLRMIVSESTPQGTRTKRAPTDSGSREFSDRLQAIVAAHAASAQTNPASEAFMDRLRVHSSRLMPSDATNAAKAISATNTRPEQVRPPVPAKVATPPTPRGP